MADRQKQLAALENRARLAEAELAEWRDKADDLLRAKDAMDEAVFGSSYREAEEEYDAALDALRALRGRRDLNIRSEST